jgi:hypothetical protein
VTLKDPKRDQLEELPSNGSLDRRCLLIKFAVWVSASSLDARTNNQVFQLGKKRGRGLRPE